MVVSTYWFEITGEESVLCGEEFFVEEANQRNAVEYARELFPGETIRCLGRVSQYEAEMMGLDTY